MFKSWGFESKYVIKATKNKGKKLSVYSREVGYMFWVKKGVLWMVRMRLD